MIILFSLYLTANIIKGFTYTNGIKTLLIGALAFFVINFFIKPVAKLLMLPFNLLTLGIFSWIINVLMLYLLTIIVPQIKVMPWSFSGLSYEGITLPSYNFNIILTYIVSSFFIAFILNFLNWFFDNK